MSEDLREGTAHPWRCPACAFAAPSADALVAHVRFVHVRPAFEEPPTRSWRCPFEHCTFPMPFRSAAGFADHLDKHLLAQAKKKHRIRRRRYVRIPFRRADTSAICSVPKCGRPVRAAGRCPRHYYLLLRLRTRLKERDAGR